MVAREVPLLRVIARRAQLAVMAKVASYVAHQQTVFGITDYGTTRADTETLLSAYDAFL